MIVVFPSLNAVTNPVLALMVATLVLLLLHKPPAIAFDKVLVFPIPQIVVVPVIGTVGVLKLVQVPVLVEPDAAQFELTPVNAKPLSTP